MADSRIEPDGVERARRDLEQTRAAQAADGALLARASEVVQALRGERKANHWADKIGAQFRGVA